MLVPPTVQGRPGICFGCGRGLVVPVSSNTVQEKYLAFSPGDRVADRYVIDERIGQGGMGVVYRAHDRLVDERVALKFMNPRLLRTQRGQRLFIQEAQVARRLRHDSIVAVHDVSCTAEGILYLSMEFLKGRSLREFLLQHREARKPVNVRLAVTLVSQILDALDYAHRMVVHRDIKPENVMLLPGERVKVLDFGLAKALYEEQTAEPQGEIPQTGKTPSPRPAGTQAYAAPEQKLHRAVDSRADIYCVGLLLHELLTLRTPLDEPVAVADVRADVSPSLVAVLTKALQAEKENRWPSAKAFRTNLLKAFDESYRQAAKPRFHKAAAQRASVEEMVYLEGGDFLMGDNDVPEEAPEFEAHVEPFYIDKYPVTVEQYEAFLKATGHVEPKFWHKAEFKGPNQPVVGVSWEDACAYATWAGKQLPSEAQWEFAARGKENRRYPWGNQNPDSMRCNFGDFLSIPTIVTMHEEGCTPEGVYDLAGNVYEWTLDCFLPYDPSRQGAAATTGSPRRVVRGGAWDCGPQTLRCTHRKGLFRESRSPALGFRCVVPAH